MTSVVRHPAVAGRFYPRMLTSLREEVEFLSFTKQLPAGSRFGCIAPHAGYMYSGHVAGAVFARIEIPRRCIVMCPNHTAWDARWRS